MSSLLISLKIIAPLKICLFLKIKSPFNQILFYLLQNHKLHLFSVCFLTYLFVFIFGCVVSSLLCAGFLQLRRVGATLRCGARASHCGGFSCCRAQAPGARASVVVACGLSSCGLRALEHRLSSCGARAQLLRSMWDLPGPGLEPVSPALAGGFLTTVSPGKSLQSCFLKYLDNFFI